MQQRYGGMGAMNDKQYAELLDTVISLRDATALGFRNVDRRFDEMEERWGRRHNALESRFDGLEKRFDCLEVRFDHLEVRFDGLEKRVDGLGDRCERGFLELSTAISGIGFRLDAVERR